MTNLEKYKDEIASAIVGDWDGVICEAFSPNFENKENGCEGCILEHVKCSSKEAVLAWLDDEGEKDDTDKNSCNM